eukprot:scaffold825_cov249-Pinguiococcus_pyrenoidosus.AAC.73
METAKGSGKDEKKTLETNGLSSVPPFPPKDENKRRNAFCRTMIGRGRRMSTSWQMAPFYWCSACSRWESPLLSPYAQQVVLEVDPCCAILIC